MSFSFVTPGPGDFIEETHISQFIEPILRLERDIPRYAQTVTGSGGVFNIELGYVPASYEPGMLVHFQAGQGAVGPTYLDVSGLGPRALTKGSGVPISVGDFSSGQLISAVFDGSEFRMLNHPLTTTVSPPTTENRLVFAEVAESQPQTTAVVKQLGSAQLDASRKYLLEVDAVGPASSTPAVQVQLSNGNSSEVLPRAGEFVSYRASEGAMRFKKILPMMDGVFSISAYVASIGALSVKLYEVRDNLVYADTSSVSNASLVTQSLQPFLAQSGRRYLLTARGCAYSTSVPTMSCYLSNGLAVGFPDVQGPTQAGSWEVSKLLQDLTGSYDVLVSSQYCGGVTVEITDVT